MDAHLVFNPIHQAMPAPSCLPVTCELSACNMCRSSCGAVVELTRAKVVRTRKPVKRRQGMEVQKRLNNYPLEWTLQYGLALAMSGSKGGGRGSSALLPPARLCFAAKPPCQSQEIDKLGVPGDESDQQHEDWRPLLALGGRCGACARLMLLGFLSAGSVLRWR